MSETKENTSSDEVKHIDEHYQEIVDKIMDEYFEDETHAQKSTNKSDGKGDEAEEKTVSTSSPVQNEDSPSKDVKQNIRRTLSKDIETQTDESITSGRRPRSDTSNEPKEADESRSCHDEKSEDFRYENKHFEEYNDIAKENFHEIHRYHLAHTLPVGTRNRMLIEIRALGVDRLNICLFGGPGCGKSALLNTMYGVVTSQYVEHSPERKLGKRYRECVTNSRLELRLTENISILDNRGVNFSKASLNEVKKQCEGLREAEETIPPDWKSTISQKGRDVLKLCNKRMLLRDRVHCPVVVSSITQDLDKNAMKRLIHLIKQACFCDPIVVILTNIHDSESTKTFMAKSRKSYFETIGCKSVHEVNVYTSSSHKNNVNTDEAILNILYQCCLLGDKAVATTLNNYRKSACC